MSIFKKIFDRGSAVFSADVQKIEVPVVTEQSVPVVESSTTFPIEKQKTEVEKKVEEIHNTFYTEVDKLIDLANQKEHLTVEDEDKYKKGKELAALGFTSTKCAEYQEKVNQEEQEIEKTNAEKDKLIKAIKYFQVKYPQYKFITEESVKKICEKYGLVYATVDRYIGTVPDENLEAIKNFKIAPKDKVYFSQFRPYTGRTSRWRIIDYAEYENGVKEDRKFTSEADKIIRGNNHIYKEAILEIAASLSDFNLKNHEVKDFKLTEIFIPDPIVLQPVLFEEQKYYLIVTAWGPEASDEKVINEIMN